MPAFTALHFWAYACLPAMPACPLPTPASFPCWGSLLLPALPLPVYLPIFLPSFLAASYYHTACLLPPASCLFRLYILLLYLPSYSLYVSACFSQHITKHNKLFVFILTFYFPFFTPYIHASHPHKTGTHTPSHEPACDFALQTNLHNLLLYAWLLFPLSPLPPPISPCIDTQNSQLFIIIKTFVILWHGSLKLRGTLCHNPSIPQDREEETGTSSLCVFCGTAGCVVRGVAFRILLASSVSPPLCGIYHNHYSVSHARRPACLPFSCRLLRRGGDARALATYRVHNLPSHTQQACRR